MYAAYARRVPVAGVVSISGPMAPEDALHWVRRDERQPPLQMITGEKDLEHVVKSTPGMVDALAGAGVSVAWSTVPGGTHFYSSSSITAEGRSVLDTVTAALKRWTCLP